MLNVICNTCRLRNDDLHSEYGSVVIGEEAFRHLNGDGV